MADYSTNAKGIRPNIHWHGTAVGTNSPRPLPVYSTTHLTETDALSALAVTFRLTGAQAAVLGAIHNLPHPVPGVQHCEITACHDDCLTTEHQTGYALIHLSSNNDTKNYALAGCDICRKLLADDEEGEEKETVAQQIERVDRNRGMRAQHATLREECTKLEGLVRDCENPRIKSFAEGKLIIAHAALATASNVLKASIPVEVE